MDVYIMQHNYDHKYLVIIIDTNVYVYKYENYKFDPPFLSFQAKNFFIGKSKVCEIIEFSSAGDETDFDGKTLFSGRENNEYLYICGLWLFKFKTDDKIISYICLMDNNMVPYTFILGEKCTYFL